MSSSTSATTSKVSFTIRRPTPVSRQSSAGVDSDRDSSASEFKVPALPRHVIESGRSTLTSPLAHGGSRSSSGRSSRAGARPKRSFAEPDSSDEEEEVDEIVTGFDQFGVQRPNAKKKEGPLVIPALKNRDWREIARKRKAAEMFVPSGGAAKTGADGSVGGLGTKDTINSGPQLAGLVKSEVTVKVENGDVEMEEIVQQQAFNELIVEKKEETEDEKALKAILRSADPDATPEMDGELTINGAENAAAWMKPKNETEAFQQDILTRPDEATMDDYTRVPVSEFGAALLRGMGWKPGMAASRTRTGPVEPYLPTARPALLGIGAKERVIEDDGSTMNGKKGKNNTKRPDKKYVPVIKRERTRDDRDDGSKPNSRRASISPDRERDTDKRRERDRDRLREKDREDRRTGQERTRDRERTYSGADDDKYRRSDRDKEKDSRSDRRYDDKSGDRERERDRRYDRDYDNGGESRSRRDDRDRRR